MYELHAAPGGAGQVPCARGCGRRGAPPETQASLLLTFIPHSSYSSQPFPACAQELIEGLTDLFTELDVNASGSVSMDELVTGLDRLGYDIRLEGEH